MVKHFLCTRHYEGINNETDTWASEVCKGLSEKGKEQRVEGLPGIVEKIESLDYKKVSIYTSSLQRTIESSELLYRYLESQKGIRIVHHKSLKELNEIHPGELEGKTGAYRSYMTTHEKWFKWSHLLTKMGHEIDPQKHPSDSYGSGESYLNVWSRSRQAIEQIIMKENDKETLPCIWWHAGAMRVAFTALARLRADTKIRIHNGQSYICEVNTDEERPGLFKILNL